MSAANPVDPAELPRGERPAWRELFVALIGPVIGVVVAWFALSMVVLPVVGYPKAAERVIAMGEMLNGERGEDLVFVIGNSVGVEGIDASVVEENAGGDLRVRNISCNGLGLVTVRAMVPKVLETGTKRVCLSLVPRMINEVHAPHPDRAYAMASGGFARGYSDDDLDALEAWMDGESYGAVLAPAWRSRLHFRLSPVNVFNERVRAKMRSGVRLAPPDDWDSPHELKISIKDRRLDRHLDETGRGVARAIESEERSGAALIREIVDRIRAGSAEVVLVLPGLHPELLEEAAPLRGELEALCDELARSGGVRVVNLAGSFPAELWADAVHMNENGRHELSARLGRALSGSNE